MARGAAVMLRYLLTGGRSVPATTNDWRSTAADFG